MELNKKKVEFLLNNMLKIVKRSEQARMPTRGTPGSAGLDLYACLDQPVTIAPGDLVKIPTGISIGLPSSGYAAFLFARSGLAVKHGVNLSNGVGVIDSDYTGELIVGLCNVSSVPYTITPQERIAQLVVLPVSILEPVEVDSLEETQRGEGGFGSTGKF